MDVGEERSGADNDSAIAMDRDTSEKPAGGIAVKEEAENDIQNSTDHGSPCNSDDAVESKTRTEDQNEISKSEAECNDAPVDNDKSETASNDAPLTEDTNAATAGCSGTNTGHHEGREGESTSSDKTFKIINFSKETKKESNAKPSYRSAKEAAYILGLSIAREHPNTMMLEKYVTFHSS